MFVMRARPAGRTVPLHRTRQVLRHDERLAVRAARNIDERIFG
jgi:hypothetical protein